MLPSENTEFFKDVASKSSGFESPQNLKESHLEMFQEGPNDEVQHSLT